MTMPLPFVIDNLAHRLVDTLNDLLGQSAGKPLDIATAYFSISGYRIVKDGLDKLGAFRLLLGTDPQSGADLGLKVDPNALNARGSRRAGRMPISRGACSLAVAQENTVHGRTDRILGVR
jgi:hypothetical protein